jgi:hypothetical protein
MGEVFMQADKNLTKDINKAETFEDLKSLLENAVARSGIANRDPETGQFVRRDPLTPAAQTATPADDAEKQITKTEVIGGQEFEFTGTQVEVDKQIAKAYRIAGAVKASQPVVPATPRPRVKTRAEREREIYDRTELDLQFRRGELTTAEYLDKTNAIGEYLAEKGFDVEAASLSQFNQNWAQATEIFINDTPEGQRWRGGEKNKEILGNLLIAHGLTEAQDKVAALRAMAKEMTEKGLEFDGDISPEQLQEMTHNMNPQEIVQAWKEKQPDPEAANAEFIRLHSSGSSGIFDA